MGSQTGWAAERPGISETAGSQTREEYFISAIFSD